MVNNESSVSTGLDALFAALDGELGIFFKCDGTGSIDFLIDSDIAFSGKDSIVGQIVKCVPDRSSFFAAFQHDITESSGKDIFAGVGAVSDIKISACTFTFAENFSVKVDRTGTADLISDRNALDCRCISGSGDNLAVAFDDQIIVLTVEDEGSVLAGAFVFDGSIFTAEDHTGEVGGITAFFIAGHFIGGVKFTAEDQGDLIIVGLSCIIVGFDSNSTVVGHVTGKLKVGGNGQSDTGINKDLGTEVEAGTILSIFDCSIIKDEVLNETVTVFIGEAD